MNVNVQEHQKVKVINPYDAFMTGMYFDHEELKEENGFCEIKFNNFLRRWDSVLKERNIDKIYDVVQEAIDYPQVIFTHRTLHGNFLEYYQLTKSWSNISNDRDFQNDVLKLQRKLRERWFLIAEDRKKYSTTFNPYSSHFNSSLSDVFFHKEILLKKISKCALNNGKFLLNQKRMNMNNSVINDFDILLNNCNKNQCKLTLEDLKKLDMWNNKIIKINRDTKKKIKSLTQVLSTKEDTIIDTNRTYNDIFLCASKKMILNMRIQKKQSIKRRRLSSKNVGNINYPINFEIKKHHDLKDVFIYHHFLYMHKMKPGINHRLEFMSNKKKNNYRNCLAEMYQITDAVHVEVTSRLFYIWNGFEENPHGMQMLSKKESTIKLLQLASNEKEVLL